MTTSTPSLTNRMFGRARQIWAELDYVQRRLLEIRTGIPSLLPDQRERADVHGRSKMGR